MNFQEAMEQALGLPPDADSIDSVPDALELLRDEYGGNRGLVQFLADDLGIPERTAYYYAAGRSVRQPDRRALIIEAAGQLADERRDAAMGDHLAPLRTAGAVDVGRVAVQYDDQDAGTRYVGSKNMADLDAVADLIEEEDWAAAAAEFSGQLMTAYGDGAEVLDVSDYPSGITLR